MTKTGRRLLTIAAIAVLLVAVAFFFWRDRTSSVPPSTLTKASLRLQWVDQAQFAGYYVAKAKGFYRDEGLDVTINAGGPDYNAMTLVASGSDTFGIWTGDQLVLGMSKGMPLEPLAAIFDRSLVAFMVKANSPIHSPKDFEGHTVGMYYGYDTETLYLALLKKFHVDRTKIHETPVQFDLGRFFDGDVDVWPGYVINQPLVAAQRHVPVRLLTPEEYGIKYYSDILFASRSYVKGHPALVSGFLKATVRGWKYALAHRKEAVDIVMARSPHLDRGLQTKMLDVVADYINLHPNSQFKLDRATWASVESLLKEQGLLKNKVPLSDLTAGNKIAR